MNRVAQFDASATRDAFADLLTAGPNGPEKLVTDVIEAVMQDALGEGNPDATATFNELLCQAGKFTLGTRSEFLGDEAKAEHAWCLTQVLVGLVHQVVNLENTYGKRVWGWESLNRDAQAWCWTLLWCRVPTGFSATAHRALIEAKALVAQIVPVPIAPPIVDRLPEAIPGEATTLDHGE